MKRRSSTTVLVLGVASLLAAGGTLTAWASWTTGATSAPVTAKADRIPTMSAPKVQLADGKPRITWSAVSRFPVDGYVVTRLTGAGRSTVCTVPDSATTCVDGDLSAGSTATYVVRATLGPRWAGSDSKPSKPVTIEAAKTDDAKVDPVKPSTGKAVEPESPAPPPEPAAATTAAEPPEKKDEKKDDPPATSSTTPETETPAADASSPDPAPSISE